MDKQATQKGLVKAASIMGLFTMFSRVLGLVREIVRAHFLGTSLMADAFTMAFMIPNLFRRLVGEGSMSAAAVPVFLDEHKAGGTARLNEVVNAFFTLFTFLLTVLCLLFVVFADPLVRELFARGFASNPEKLALTVELTQYMFFYLLFIGLAAVVQAVLNSFKVFGPSAFTPILLNISVILCALLLGWAFEKPVYAFALGVMLGGSLQLFFQLPYLKKAGLTLRPSFRFGDKAVRRILSLMAPGILGAGVYQINVVISQMIATYLSDGAVSALQYSSRLEEFTLGVFVIAISTAVLPTFAIFVRDGKMQEFRDTLEFALRLVAYITIPAAIGLIMIREPLIALLFRTGRFDAVSIQMTAHAFLFHAAGLYFIGASRILVPVFYSMKDMITPVKAAVVATLVNIACSLVFAIHLDQGGIALANSVSVFAQVIVLIAYFSVRVGGLAWGQVFASLGRILLACAVMGALAYYLVGWLDLNASCSRLQLIGGLLPIVLLCAALYAGLTRLFRCQEFGELTSMLRRRARRSR